MPKLSMGTGSRVLMCHGMPPLCRGPHDSANDNLELKLRPVEVRLLAPFAALYVDALIAAHDAKYLYWRLRPSMADPTIVPLIPLPNHPAYVSNAAIIASAVAELVGYMFLQEAAHWRYLGEEAGLSRLYGGIHYPSDERVGNQMGKRLGALAIQRDQRNGS